MRCDACGADAGVGARFCGGCGAALKAEPQRLRVALGTGEAGDRRIVTALFADLVDYVRMVAEHDPEDVRRRVRGALSAMADVIERFGGTREKFIGDAVFAVFGWPRAHDDDAIRAALAGLGIRAALANVRDDDAEPLEVRIGIATGEVVTTRRSESTPEDLALTGGAITTAARIQSLARPGEILLDAATVSAARGRLVVAARGSVVLRGQSESISIFALGGELGLGGYGLPRPRSPGRLVGRHDELERIRALFGRAKDQGRGGVILVVGEAGIGKTRLLAEVESEARDQGFAWTWTENTSYGRSEPYRFARVFAQAIADEHEMDSGSFARMMLFTPDLDAEDIRRLGGAVAAIARDAAFTGWEAEATNTPADPAALTATLGEVAGRYIDRIAETAGPRVVVIDDLHWMDPSSVGLVEILVDRTSRAPLIVLAGMRPGPAPYWNLLPWVDRIDLAGLAMPETAQLATEVARAALDAADARRIHERTAGNPLFVTETVRTYLDDGTLAWHDGRVTLADAPGGSVPLTLRAVLGARIDALAQDAREVIGVGSVVGMRFDEEAVASLLDGPIEAGTMEGLVDAGLILPTDDGGWRFGHPLIHDAAYAGLLASRRRQLHAALADRLESSKDPSRTNLIAVHRAASGDAVRAIPLLEVAADSAIAVGAASEAAAFWRTAADLSADPAMAADYRSRAAAALEVVRPS